MQKEKTKLIKVSTMLPQDLYVDLKVQSAASGRKIKDLIQEAIEASLA